MKSAPGLVLFITAILGIVVQPPRDAERLRKNPLGLFIHAINWSKELGD